MIRFNVIIFYGRPACLDGEISDRNIGFSLFTIGRIK